MAKKVSEYTTAATVFASGDLFDLTKLVSTGPDVYESQKANANLLAGWNLFGQDQTMPAPRLHNLSNNQLSLTNGRLLLKGSDNIATDLLKLESLAGTEVFKAQNNGTIKISNAFTLPVADGTAGQALLTDGAGAVSFGAVAGTGIFGITNSSGAYTYYTTFQLALAAATSGDTIEQFSDVSVSTSTSITLDKDITWNMNGYEYKNTSTSSFIMLDVPATTTVKITINNGKITRNTGSSDGGILFDTGSELNSIIKINGVTFENVEGSLLSGSATIIGGVYRSSGTTTFFYSGKVYTIKMFANVAGTFNGVNARVYDSIFEISAGYAYLNNGAEAYNSYFKGSTYGLRLGVGANKAYNCTCEATVFHGIFVTSGELHNCDGFSALYYGIQLSGTLARAYNCTAKSDAQVAMWLISGQAYNCFVLSLATPAVHIQTANSVFKGGSVICKLNNSTGKGFYITADNFDITNNTIEVVNAAAPCITGTAGRTGKFAGNIFKGSTTAVTVVTNSITNTQDSQGNILI